MKQKKLPKILEETVLGKIRDNLNEGRNMGMGFAFALQKDDFTYQPIHPLSCCKDYLNDFVYAETTGKSVTAYGLTVNKMNLWKDKPVFLVFKLLPKFGYTAKESWPRMKEQNPSFKFHKDARRLRGSYKHIEKLVNHVEEQLKFTERTTIFRATRLSYVAVLPKEWVKSTPMISLCSLIIRMGQYYDGKQAPDAFLETYHLQYPLDKTLWTAALPYYKQLIKGQPVPEIDYLNMPSYMDSGSKIHNAGFIYAYTKEFK